MDGHWYLMEQDIIMEKVILQTIQNQIFKRLCIFLTQQ